MAQESRLNYNELDNNIKKIELYRSEEVKVLNKIVNYCNQAINCYNSDNSSRFVEKNGNIQKQITTISNNRIKCMTYLEKTIVKYRQTEKMTIDSIKKIGG